MLKKKKKEETKQREENKIGGKKKRKRQKELLVHHLNSGAQLPPKPTQEVSRGKEKEKKIEAEVHTIAAGRPLPSSGASSSSFVFPIYIFFIFCVLSISEPKHAFQPNPTKEQVTLQNIRSLFPLVFFEGSAFSLRNCGGIEFRTLGSPQMCNGIGFRVKGVGKGNGIRRDFGFPIFGSAL